MKFLAALNLPTPAFLEKYSSYLFPVAVFTFAFYLQHSVAFFGLDLHHDLLMFDAARNFYSGQVPYKDFFYQYNLGTLFLHGATLSVLGLKIISLKKITVLSYALIALLIYLSCALEGYRRSGFLLSILWALLSPFYMLAMNGYHPWSTVYMMVACMAGLLFLQLASKKNPLVYSLVAGSFFSLSFWFKQVAAYQIIAVTFWLAISIWLAMGDKIFQRKYLKIFLGYAVGGALTSIPFFSYLYAESAILDWWTNAFTFNRYFAADSQNASGTGSLLKILFPISRDMSYRSFIWALSPLVLCVAAFQLYSHRGFSFGLSKSKKETFTLFLLAGFAGWLEYFPLPHQFHTQLFMAPTFVIVGLLLGGQSATWESFKKYTLNFLALFLFVMTAGYEGIRHVDGWNKKRTFFERQSVLINLNSSFDGLKIESNTAESLTQFYRKLVELKSISKSGEYIPLSVDPIRGILPGKADQPSEFKMGVNWTWPNELVEPGFVSKVNDEIQLRSQPIYADSLIYIPGYMPASLLSMIAPISWVHTIYKPLAQKSELQIRVKKSSEILYVSDRDFDIKSRSIIFGRDYGKKELILIPVDGLSESEIKNIKNIHISVVEDQDFPRRLSSLQMSYLSKAGKYYGLNPQELFSIGSQGNGVLRKNISIEDQKKLALFMLSTGKLFTTQNKPAHSSTLWSSSLDQPVVVGLTGGSQNLQMLWGDSKYRATIANGAIYPTTQIYLATKPILSQSESKFIIMQMELENGQMKNYFYSFLND